MDDLVLYPEEVGVLLCKAHIVDAIFFKVREVPLDVLCRHLVDRGLLDLDHEVLAVLLLEGGDVVEATRLCVKLSTSLTHTDEARILRDLWYEDRLTLRVLSAIDSIDDGLVGAGVTATYVEDEVGSSAYGVSVALFVELTLDTDDADRIVEREHAPVSNRQLDAGVGGLLCCHQTGCGRRDRTSTY